MTTLLGLSLASALLLVALPIALLWLRRHESRLEQTSTALVTTGATFVGVFLAFIVGAKHDAEVSRQEVLALIKAVHQQASRSIEILEQTDPRDAGRGSIVENTLEDPVSSLRTLLDRSAFFENAVPEVSSDLAILSTGIWSPPRLSIAGRWPEGGGTRPPNRDRVLPQLRLLISLLDIQAALLRGETTIPEAFQAREAAWSSYREALAKKSAS